MSQFLHWAIFRYWAEQMKSPSNSSSVTEVNGKVQLRNLLMNSLLLDCKLFYILFFI